MAELALSVSEAAEKLGISADTVYRMIAEGRFPVYRTGKGKKSGIRIPVDALVKHLTDVDLAAVKPVFPEVSPVPADLQIRSKRGHKKSLLQPWMKPGCGGRKRKSI